MNTYPAQLLNIALQDIKASKLLYEKRLYAQSFFHFQQATEKVFKAYGILNSVITVAEVKKISHNPIEIYRKIVAAEKEKMAFNIEQTNKHPNIKNHPAFPSLQLEHYAQQLSEEDIFIQRLKNVDTKKMNRYDHLDFLESIIEIEKLRFRVPKEKYKAKMTEYFYSYHDLLVQVNPSEADELMKELKKKGAIDEMIDYSIKYTKLYFKATFISKVLYFCAIATMSKHVETTRYPIDNINPLTFYGRRLPAVQFQPEYLRLLKKATRSIKKLFKEKLKMTGN